MTTAAGTRGRWYSGMVVPTVILWSCAAVSAVLSLMQANENPDATSFLLRIAFAVAVSIWVTADARQRRRELPYDYDSFMFFLWPVLAPIYLWQTRRWRMFVTVFWFVVLLLVASVGDIVWLLRADDF